MKKVLLLSIIFCALSLSVFSQAKNEQPKKDTTETKFLKVEGKLEDWGKHFERFDRIRFIIDNSDLPNLTTKFIISSLDSFKLFSLPQLQSQMKQIPQQKRP